MNLQQSPPRIALILSAVVVATVVAALLLGGRIFSPAAVALSVTSPFVYFFKIDGTLNEAGDNDSSTSPYWWLNSGGQLILKDQNGMTMQGDAAALSRWRIAYAAANPIDTDNGLHPQNLFRMVSRSLWENVRAEAYFRINKDNLSKSSNRNDSNGLLIMTRYAEDGQTLYYAGIRVDGTAVIKKKYNGVYYTMAQKQIFPGSWNRDTTPNLLPHKEWIGLRAETETLGSGNVRTRLYMKRENETTWTALLTATDDGKAYSATEPIRGKAYIGIRTDFMDVSFRNFSFATL